MQHQSRPELSTHLYQMSSLCIHHRRCRTNTDWNSVSIRPRGQILNFNPGWIYNFICLAGTQLTRGGFTCIIGPLISSHIFIPMAVPIIYIKKVYSRSQRMAKDVNTHFGVEMKLKGILLDVRHGFTCVNFKVTQVKPC